MTTPNGRAEIEAMFGNPANPDGTANQAWQSSNIQKIAPQDDWRLFYQDYPSGTSVRDKYASPAGGHFCRSHG